METPGPRFAAGFEEVAWTKDVSDPYPAGSNARTVAEFARREFERRGVTAGALKACDPEGRDHTRLEGLLKV